MAFCMGILAGQLGVLASSVVDYVMYCTAAMSKREYYIKLKQVPDPLLIKRNWLIKIS